MALKKIVVGTDFSPGAEVATRRAGEVASQHGAEIVLVHATTVPQHPDVPESMAATASALVKVLDDRLAEERSQLGTLRERLATENGVAVSQLIVDDYPDDALVEVSASLGADLVITGSREKSAIRRWLLGSTAEHVVRRAEMSVLVARPGDPDRGFNRIVVGTDFSPGAQIALERAVEMALPGASLDLVHCLHHPMFRPVPGVDPVLADDYKTFLEQLVVEASTRMQEATSAFRDRVQFRFHVVEEQPREAVCDLAEKLQADLVAVGSHGRRGLRRLVLGSVAEATVRHAPCSVLVAR